MFIKAVLIDFQIREIDYVFGAVSHRSESCIQCIRSTTVVVVLCRAFVTSRQKNYTKINTKTFPNVSLNTILPSVPLSSHMLDGRAF